jgi:hypothetical protein
LQLKFHLKIKTTFTGEGRHNVRSSSLESKVLNLLPEVFPGLFSLANLPGKRDFTVLMEGTPENEQIRPSLKIARLKLVCPPRFVRLLLVLPSISTSSSRVGGNYGTSKAPMDSVSPSFLAAINVRSGANAAIMVRFAAKSAVEEDASNSNQSLRFVPMCPRSNEVIAAVQ